MLGTGRIPLEANPRKHPFRKEVTSCDDWITAHAESASADWLTKQLSPNELAEKYIILLETHHTHTHLHVQHSVLQSPSIETAKTKDLEKLEKEFAERADRWEKESSIHSSPGEKFIHRDYLRIIGKGEQVVPLIIKRQESSNKDWLFALENIIPEDENPAKGIESFKDAVEAWISWGKKKYQALA